MADTENSRIQIFSSSGKLLQVVSGKGDSPECLNHPMCVALTTDGEERIVVTDSVNASIKVSHPTLVDYLTVILTQQIKRETSQSIAQLSETVSAKLALHYPKWYHAKYPKLI